MERFSQCNKPPLISNQSTVQLRHYKWKGFHIPMQLVHLQGVGLAGKTLPHYYGSHGMIYSHSHWQTPQWWLSTRVIWRHSWGQSKAFPPFYLVAASTYHRSSSSNLPSSSICPPSVPFAVFLNSLLQNNTFNSLSASMLPHLSMPWMTLKWRLADFPATWTSWWLRQTYGMISL